MGHPNNNECFYLHLLLVNVCRSTSFTFLHTVNDELYATYQEVGQCLHLFEDDIHWKYTLTDVILSTAHQIQSRFAINISTCFSLNRLHLWTKYKDNMAEDILHRMHTMITNPELEFNVDGHNEALIYIEHLCLTMLKSPRARCVQSKIWMRMAIQSRCFESISINKGPPSN